MDELIVIPAQTKAQMLSRLAFYAGCILTLFGISQGSTHLVLMLWGLPGLLMTLTAHLWRIRNGDEPREDLEWHRHWRECEAERLEWERLHPSEPYPESV